MIFIYPFIHKHLPFYTLNTYYLPFYTQKYKCAYLPLSKYLEQNQSEKKNVTAVGILRAVRV